VANGAGDAPFSSGWMRWCSVRGYGCVDVFDAGAGFLGSGKARRGGGAQGWCALCGERLEVRAKKVERASR
jgi:hypothetical protein